MSGAGFRDHRSAHRLSLNRKWSRYHIRWKYGAGGGGFRRNYRYPSGKKNRLRWWSSRKNWPRNHGPR